MAIIYQFRGKLVGELVADEERLHQEWRTAERTASELKERFLAAFEKANLADRQENAGYYNHA